MRILSPVQNWIFKMGRQLIDLTGKEFGKWYVRRKVYKKGREWYWECICECGNEKILSGQVLRRGQSKSCGCLFGKRAKDLTGKTFTNLTVIKEYHGPRKEYNKGKKHWVCLCNCGKETIATTHDLTVGFKKSCGCLRKSQH